MLVLPVLVLAGCAVPSSGVHPLFKPDSEALFDAPWPTDALLGPDGTPDLSRFPNPEAIPLLDTYLAAAETIEGYSANGPIYVPFDGAIDTSTLPTPAASTLPGSALLLVDVDPESPWWGEALPVQWSVQTTSTTYQPANLLAVAPVYGFPMHPATTYALVVSTAVADRNADFSRVWQPDDPSHALYAPLEPALFFHGLTTADVAIATVFTTGDPVGEMDRVASFLHHDVGVPTLSQTVEPLYRTSYYQVFEGHYPGPVFQEGVRPYSSEGGGFVFRDDGRPIIQSWDDMRIAICTPNNLDNPPKGGWPVVIQQHGTGGDFVNHCQNNDSNEIASNLAEIGFIAIGIDQPLYGTRVGPTATTDLDTFNFINPVAGRWNFRQGAADAIYLAHALHAAAATFTTESGTTITTNPDQVYLLGHSQGGLTAALATPWLGDDTNGVVLSGAGGVLSITVVERKSPFDIASTLEAAFQFSGDETLTELHPIVGMIQEISDATDPINYAPYWWSIDAGFDGAKPTPVLLFSGFKDEDTTHATAEALAGAAPMPQLDPAGNSPIALQLRGLDPLAAPLDGDVPDWNGDGVTAAISQWPTSDHYVIWKKPAAGKLYRNFLASIAAGTPTIGGPAPKK